MAKSNKITYLGTGRRKSSVARVRLVEGTGKITINGKDIEEYFDLDTLKVIVRQPLTVTNTLSKYDVICSVYGGGQDVAIPDYNLLDKRRIIINIFI